MVLPHIVAVILNTNRCEDTLACLQSLRETAYQNLTVLVLDNSSTDGSVEAVSACFPEVKIIRLEQNLGYAGNNNVGIKAALELEADWVLVLNEDTILDSNCLSLLAEAGESSPDTGIVGPLVYHFDEPQVIQSAGGLMNGRWQLTQLGMNEPDRGQYSGLRAVHFISGCAIMVRRQAIEQNGGLDDRFFYYWEETDWCLRILKSGWKIIHVPQAKLWHKGVQRDYKPSPNITYYWTRNWFLLLSKHKAPLSARLYVWTYLARTLISWSVRPKWRAKRAHRDAIWQGMRDFLRRQWGQRITHPAG